jgi:hypothetical protein
MSIPPASLTITTILAVARSGTMLKYSSFAIRNDAEIQLLFDLQALLHEHFFNEPALRTRLVGHQRHAENPIRHFGRLAGGVGELHASSLAPAAGVNLGFHHHGIAAEPIGHRFRILGGERHSALRNGNVVFPEQLLCLVFMNFHGISFSVPR